MQRRLRVAAAMTILALAGCVDETPSATKSAEAAVAQPEAPFNVKIDALGRVRPDQARLLSVLLRQDLGSSTYRIEGALDAASADGSNGLYVIAVVDLKDMGGARLHRIVDEERIERAANAPLIQSDIERLAGKLSTKLALWRGETQMNFALDEGLDGPLAGDALATGSLRHEEATSAKMHFDIAMGPAPGDGTAALSEALAGALARRAPSGDWGCGCYSVRGEVAIGPAEAGDTAVTIGWTVATKDGRPLGKVTLQKDVAPGDIAANWGRTAEDAAEAAVDGILAVVLPESKRQSGA
jgi:hypothetical protein